MLYSDALEGFWLARRRDYSPHTVSDYQLTFKRFQSWVGKGRHIETIAGPDIDGFLQDLAETHQLAAKTRLNAWTALSAFWTWAETTLGIPHIIRGQIRRPRPHRPYIQPLDERQVKAILEALKTDAAWDHRYARNIRSKRDTADRDRAIVLVLIDTGIRASELVNLDVRDYTPSQGSLSIRHGKGDKSRNVYPGDTTRSAIWKYLAGRDDAKPTSPLFVSRSGRRMDRTNLGHLLSRAGQRANVNGVHPHRFRHTFAINFLRNGGNVLALQAILGHETMDTVRTYVRLAQIDLANAQHNASPVQAWRL